MQTHKFVYYVNGNFTVTTRAKTKHCMKSNQVYIYLCTYNEIINYLFKYSFFQNFFKDMYFFYKSIYIKYTILIIFLIYIKAGFHKDFEK